MNIAVNQFYENCQRHIWLQPQWFRESWWPKLLTKIIVLTLVILNMLNPTIFEKSTCRFCKKKLYNKFKFLTSFCKLSMPVIMIKGFCWIWYKITIKTCLEFQIVLKFNVLIKQFSNKLPKFVAVILNRSYLQQEANHYLQFFVAITSISFKTISLILWTNDWMNQI